MDSGAASPRVLVVDDDPDVLASLERGLRLSGFDVSTAVDGAEALRSATETRPDAIVLDINMPVLDGVSVVTALRAMDNDVPVCVLSAAGLAMVFGAGRKHSQRDREIIARPPYTKTSFAPRANYQMLHRPMQNVTRVRASLLSVQATPILRQRIVSAKTCALSHEM